MKRTFVFILILMATLATVWYWQKRQGDQPSITITSPSGDETWQPGEKHTIAWTTSGIPAEDKISVTIRRLSSTTSEGQEFDPIMFINVPNTGSTQWTIDPMYPDGTYVLGVHAYASVPITNEVATESAPFTITHPSLSADLYPLYASDVIAWKKSEVESFVIGTTTYIGASITSFPVTDTMDPASIFTPFQRYYDKKLKSLGWKIAPDLEAGGHVGGQEAYQKAGVIILTRFHIEYHVVTNTAPSECPCDVTVSLFSTK